MHGQSVLAIDQGTTGTKAIVVSGDGEVIGRASTEFPQYYPRPGWVEHDPLEIWDTVTGTAERALRDASVQPRELAGIGITNQRETTVAWERSTGLPVHRAIVWQDRRTAGMCRRLDESGAGQPAGRCLLLGHEDRLEVLRDKTGAAVQWLRDDLGIIGGAADTEQLAASLDSNDDVWFVPAMAGLGAPDWDPQARGTLLGVTRGTTKAHLARAVLESEAYQARDVIDVMCAASGDQITELRADGGAAVNQWLMQFQADVLGIPVDVPTVTETTSLGSAYVAGLAAGVFADRGELQRTRRTQRRYEPRMSKDQRDGLHSRWREAVQRAGHWAQEES